MKTFPIVTDILYPRTGNRLFSFALCRRLPEGVRSEAVVSLNERGEVTDGRATVDFARRYPAIERLARRYFAKSIPQQIFV